MVDRRRMTRLRTAWGPKTLAHAVAALALAAFAIAPSAEAAVCASEPAEAVFTVGGDDAGFHADAPEPAEPDEAPPVDGEQDACPHGHCHHPAGGVAPQFVTEHLAPVAAVRVRMPPSRAPPTLHPALPKRPPRV